MNITNDSRQCFLSGVLTSPPCLSTNRKLAFSLGCEGPTAYPSIISASFLLDRLTVSLHTNAQQRTRVKSILLCNIAMLFSMHLAAVHGKAAGLTAITQLSVSVRLLHPLTANLGSKRELGKMR